MHIFGIAMPVAIPPPMIILPKDNTAVFIDLRDRPTQIRAKAGPTTGKYRLKEKGMKTPSNRVIATPRHAPDIGTGIMRPSDIPTMAPENVRMYRAKMATSVSTVVNRGSRKVKQINPLRAADHIPE